MSKKKFVALLHITGFDNIQLGLHANLSLPNIEIHLPFCFFRIGMTFADAESRERYVKKMQRKYPLSYRSFGVGADNR